MHEAPAIAGRETPSPLAHAASERRPAGRRELARAPGSARVGARAPRRSPANRERRARHGRGDTEPADRPSGAFGCGCGRSSSGFVTCPHRRRRCARGSRGRWFPSRLARPRVRLPRLSVFEREHRILRAVDHQRGDGERGQWLPRDLALADQAVVLGGRDVVRALDVAADKRTRRSLVERARAFRRPRLKAATNLLRSVAAAGRRVEAVAEPVRAGRRRGRRRLPVRATVAGYRAGALRARGDGLTAEHRHAPGGRPPAIGRRAPS
jgi:hypothetical protein